MDFKRKAAACQLQAGLCELAIEFMVGLWNLSSVVRRGVTGCSSASYSIMSGADKMRETRYAELSKHFGTARRKEYVKLDLFRKEDL
jgi:hypothetical protein